MSIFFEYLSTYCKHHTHYFKVIQTFKSDPENVEYYGQVCMGDYQRTSTHDYYNILAQY